MGQQQLWHHAHDPSVHLPKWDPSSPAEDSWAESGLISFERNLGLLPNIFTLPTGFLSSTNSPAFMGSPVSVSISTTRQGCKSKASAARTRKASVVSPVPCGKWSIEIQLRVGGLGWWFRFKRFPKKSIWPYFSETTSTSTGPERSCTSKGHYNHCGSHEEVRFP